MREVAAILDLRSAQGQHAGKSFLSRWVISCDDNRSIAESAFVGKNHIRDENETQHSRSSSWRALDGTVHCRGCAACQRCRLAGGQGRRRGEGDRRDVSRQSSRAGRSCGNAGVAGCDYADVAAEYNERIEQEAAEKNKGQRYKGEQVRILRAIKEKHPEGNLYLCAYAGTPSYSWCRASL